jgi:hypothetical protein
MNEQDLKQLWKSQPAETAAFSTNELRARALAFQRRITRRNLLEYAAGAAVIAWYCVRFWLHPSLLVRTGCVLVVLGVGVVLYQLHRRLGSRTPPPENLGMPSLAFHRAELVRQRDGLRDAWLWYVAPFVPGMAVVMWGLETELAGPQSAWRGAVIPLAILALAAVGVAWLNRRAANQLQVEIDALDRQAAGPD